MEKVEEFKDSHHLLNILELLRKRAEDEKRWNKKLADLIQVNLIFFLHWG